MKYSFGIFNFLDKISPLSLCVVFFYFFALILRKSFLSLLAILPIAKDGKEGNGIPFQYSCLENPWTEEPGRLQSMGSLTVRHDWVTSLSLFTFMHWRRKWQATPVFLPGESQGRWSLVGCHLWGCTESDWSDLAVAAAKDGREAKSKRKVLSN